MPLAKPKIVKEISAKWSFYCRKKGLCGQRVSSQNFPLKLWKLFLLHSRSKSIWFFSFLRFSSVRCQLFVLKSKCQKIRAKMVSSIWAKCHLVWKKFPLCLRSRKLEWSCTKAETWDMFVLLVRLCFGGGRVVSVLAFNSDDPSSNLQFLFCKLFDKNENKLKEARDDPIILQNIS